jgi:LemA protein
MITKNQAVEKSVGDLNLQYQRRNDLLNNLIETVKQEANYEKSTLKAIVDARASASNGGLPQLDPKNLTPEQIEAFQKNAAMQQKMISIIVENYPNLKATEAYNKLMDETTGTENRVAVYRERFNAAVQDYNLSIIRFPGMIFAKLFGFKEKAFFQNQAGTENAPDYKDKFKE